MLIVSNLMAVILLMACDAFCYDKSRRGQSRIESVMNEHFADRYKKFISPYIEKKLKDGTCAIVDLDRAFSPSKQEKEYIMRRNSMGFTGVIFSLEGVLVDAYEVYGITLSSLARENNYKSPASENVLDVIGCNFHDIVLGLGWTLPNDILAAEIQFYEMFDFFLQKYSMRTKFGALNVLGELLQNTDQVSIITALPREVAVKALVMSGISTVLRGGNVDPSRLIYPDDPTVPKRSSTFGNSYREALIRSCDSLRRPSYLTTLVDGNRRTMREAKTLGLNVIGLRGNSIRPGAMRTADRVLSSLDSFRIKDHYEIARRSLAQQDGPMMQAQTVAQLLPPRPTLLIAPVEDNPKPKKDTFADEFGADVL